MLKKFFKEANPESLNAIYEYMLKNGKCTVEVPWFKHKPAKLVKKDDFLDTSKSSIETVLVDFKSLQVHLGKHLKIVR